MKNILRGLIISFILLLIGSPVLAAAPDDISVMLASPSDTSITLTWTKTSTYTVIRYSTTGYPATPSSGTSAYNGTSYQTVVTNLTAGQPYFFSAWGGVSGNYSANAYNFQMNTLPVSLPSGATDSPSISLPTPAVSAQMNQSPSAGAFQLEPFTSIINYFITAPCGLNMPVNNIWETMAILGIVTAGVGTYIRIRNFFVGFAVVFVLTFFAIGLQLVQGWLLGIEIIIGMGVWGIEHYLQ